MNYFIHLKNTTIELINMIYQLHYHFRELFQTTRRIVHQKVQSIK